MDSHIEFSKVVYSLPDGFCFNLNYSVRKGTVTCILGPSGAGKSTLLRLAGHLISPHTGRVIVSAKPKGSKSPVAMVFQDYTLYPHISIRENVVLSFQCSSQVRLQRQSMLAKLAPELGIAHVLSRRPGEISGGERQRAAILKVLASGAPIWLLDEPLSNLDVWNKYHLRSIIGEVQKKEEATVLWVTHDSSDALMVANDSLVLYNGSLAQSGPPHKIAETPKSIDVARALRNPPSNEIPGVLLLDPSGTAQIRLGESPETIASITACITQIPQSSLETKVIALIDPKCVKISPVNAQLPLHISVKGQLCLTAHFREAPIFEFTTSLGRLRAYSDPDVADKISSQGFAFLSLPFSSLEVFEAETGKILNTVANLCSGPTQS